MDLKQIFKDSFDTFKVFDNLTLAQASQTSDNTPKTIWQILNHLNIWQDYQLRLLRDESVDGTINEVDTWDSKISPVDQEELNNTIDSFKGQMDSVKSEMNALRVGEHGLERKIKIIQDMSVHLSFHLGEIILLRRMNRNYPWPHEMKEFLN
jgi:hypothetical protein